MYKTGFLVFVGLILGSLAFAQTDENTRVIPVEDAADYNHIQGVVYDKETMKPVEGAFVTIKGGDGLVAQLKTGPSGWFVFDFESIDLNKTQYVLVASANGHLNAKAVTNTDHESPVVRYEFDMYLQPHTICWEMPDFVFQPNSKNLEPYTYLGKTVNLYDSLHFVLDMLNIDSSTALQVMGVQDSSEAKGTDMQRAMRVKEWFIEHGIPAQRIITSTGGVPHTARDGTAFTEQFIRQLPNAVQKHARYKNQRVRLQYAAAVQ